MEQSWLDHLRKGRGAAVARNTVNPDAKLVVRQSVPPAQPLLDPIPISRGQAPTISGDQEFFGTRGQTVPAARLGEPIALTPAAPVLSTAAANQARHAPPPVVLFPPEPLPLR